MADNSIISGDNRKEIHTQMKAYFDKNGKSRENKPTLNLPIQILTISKDKTVSTKEISTLEDLKLLWQYCKRGKGQRGMIKEVDNYLFSIKLKSSKPGTFFKMSVIPSKDHN